MTWAKVLTAGVLKRDYKDKMKNTRVSYNNIDWKNK
jgi:hypothetical protein